MKRKQGVPVLWDEVKKRRNVMLTDTAWNLLDQKAKELGVSRSEFVELAIRGSTAWDG
jgi:hypothetical protein